METGGNILVVDDNNVFRMVVSKMLSRLGYEVSSADSGENGLNLFLKNKFDVVLSDYEMPAMDWVELACSIKKTSPRTPVVIMTGTGRETVFSRKSTAVDEVISKPFTLAQIDKTVQSVLKAAALDVPEANMSRNLRALLAARLERQGVGQAQMDGFFREMKKLLRESPDVTLPAVNARLHYLGWGDVTLDYHSMELAAFCMGGR